MEISEYLRILNRRKWTIGIAMIITVVVALVGREMMPVRYEANAIVRVIPYTNANPSYTQLAYADRIMKTYVQLGSGSVIMSNLRDELGLTAQEPLSVEISIIPETELLQIKITDYDPGLSSEVANALANYLINDKSIRDVRLTLVEPASVPAPPAILLTILFDLVASLAGLVGGIGLAFLLESLDTHVYELRQVENLSNAPILGQIPTVSTFFSRKLIATKHPCNHAFRKLVANLLIVRQSHELRTLMVTSSESHEGKSTMAVNLAYSLAHAGYKTLLMDLDFYRPTLNKYFEIPIAPGISDFLTSEIELENLIHPTELGTLSVVPNGTPNKYPDDLILKSEKLSEILDKNGEGYDFIILDSPVFLAVADGLILSRMVDGILIVVKLGVSHQPALKSIGRQLETKPTGFTGLVVNAVNNVHYSDYYKPPTNLHITDTLQLGWHKFHTVANHALQNLINKVATLKIPRTTFPKLTFHLPQKIQLQLRFAAMVSALQNQAQKGQPIKNTQQLLQQENTPLNNDMQLQLQPTAEKPLPMIEPVQIQEPSTNSIHTEKLSTRRNRKHRNNNQHPDLSTTTSHAEQHI